MTVKKLLDTVKPYDVDGDLLRDIMAEIIHHEFDLDEQAPEWFEDNWLETVGLA